MPVTTRIHVGAESFEPWGDYDRPLEGNVNTGNTGVIYTWEPETVFAAGSVISIDARSWRRYSGTTGNNHDDWYIRREAHSQDNGSRVELLEDGSPVPSVGGFMGQYSVEEFLSDYIEDDHLVADVNQAVSLFELGGSSDTSEPSFDLQDLVIMVTMIDASENTCYVEGAPSMIDVDLNNDTEIHYSGEAIAKLGLHLDSIANNLNVRVTQRHTRGVGAGETIDYVGDAPVDDGEGIASDTQGQTMVTICHKGSTKTVSENALLSHIGHGDYVGSCQ